MSSKQTAPLSLAVGAALAATLITFPAHADVNPFAMSTLAGGYMVADAKGSEAKCGANKGVVEAQCGAEKGAQLATTMAAKTAEAKCGADKKPAPKPLQEAKCGEAKCGSNKK